MDAPQPSTPKLTTEVPQLPPRPPTLHKGQAGHVTIIAGSPGMSGAAVLCGLGALRGGAGLVRVYCPQSIQPIIAASEPSLLTVSLPETADGRLDLKKPLGALDEWANAAAIGPGLGMTPSPVGLEFCLFRMPKVPVVLDADALNYLAQPAATPWDEVASDLQEWWSFRESASTIVTPHPGEMARLRKAAGLEDVRGDDDATRVRIAHEYAALTGLTVVLKGYRTVVSTATEAYINTTGNAGMATGGMGDVLTGLIAALLGQGLSGFDAARLGVYVHGLAADHCAKHVAPVGYLAREVADAIPRALTQASQPRIGFR